MPEYLSPGVYIEEFEIGAKPIEGVATSTAAFLGETERGPTRPTLVTSWLDYKRRFGGILNNGRYLPGAVNGFFDNGGRRCFVTRIVKLGDNPAGRADSGGDQFQPIRIRASGPGNWGNRISIRILRGSTDETRGFRVRVFYWDRPLEEPFASDPDNRSDEDRSKPRPSLVEDFDDLSLNPRSIDYFEKRIGGFDGTGSSSLIEVALADPDNFDPDSTAPPQPTTGTAPVSLDGVGTDGVGDLGQIDYLGEEEAGRRTGLNALDETDYDDISLIYAPNQESVQGLRAAMITHSERKKYRFAILDSESGTPSPNAVINSFKGAQGGSDSDYAAVYYPWIRAIDADTGELRTVPPGGHVAGIYGRSDLERGVWKAPANETVRNAVELEYRIPTAVQDQLNPKGINVIRAFPGRGRRVWGARTLSSDPLWKYVNVRRLFLFLEASIDRGTQWVVFEPNTPELWARVKQTITQFLRTQWREGALFGRTEEDAFFVNVDETTMSPDDIANGRLIVVVGVAPVRPAEFVIFRIAQLTGSATEVQ